MKLIQLIPGAGNTFYCENCLRDNGLVKALRRLGHDAVKVPLYLPILTDEPGATTEVPVFFGGINVYLQQKLSLFRKTPRWIDRLFDAPPLLRWAANKAGMTRATDLAETTLSMLRGEDGYQAKELHRLVTWLASEESVDVVHISNVLLAGMAAPIKQEMGTPVICTLQDEDIFVDPLPEPHRTEVWDTIAERAQDIDAFIAVSEYYKTHMLDKLQIPAEKIHVIYNGINVEDYPHAAVTSNPPVIGYLERQCTEKGLHLLAEAFVLLKKRGRVPHVKLRIAGGHTADDLSYIRRVRRQLEKEALLTDVEFLPNLTREEKLEFLRGLSVLSVPAVHQEAFGIYVIEALGAGVPVVQPAHGAFPELLDMTGGGKLSTPHDADSLADVLESLLLEPETAAELGRRGREVVRARFSVERMAEEFARVMQKVGPSVAL